MAKPLVLVTGASGFIAAHVASQFVAQGYRVRGTVRDLKDEKKTALLRSLNVELVEADLLKAESWASAVAGVTFVAHVASPFPSTNPSDPSVLIRPAVEGTLNVLKAAAAAKTVKRVVLTSSVVAVGGDDAHGDEGKVFTEEDWTDTGSPSVRAYEKSKTLAERAAWDFVRGLQGDEAFELVTILPSFVISPALTQGESTSMEVIKRLMTRDMPMVPRLSFPVVDVRDVAAAHVKALEVPEAAGQRFIVANRTMWFKEMADTMDKEFKSQGYSIPTKVAPYPILVVVSWFDKSLRMIMPRIGKETKVSNKKMVDVLGIHPIDPRKSIVDMAYSLVEKGVVKRTRKYRGPPGGGAPVS